MKSIGIDIGTTSISGVVMEENGEQIEVKTVANDTYIEGKEWEHVQDADRIWHKVQALAEEFCDRWDDIGAIGLTGQMHGMLYLDEKGQAVSNLVTWEDERGNQIFGKEKLTYAEYLTEITGYAMSTGYGLTTFFWDTMNGQVPPQAVKITTIMDYAAMKLCGLKTPLIHASNAASLGLFDPEQQDFDQKAIEKAGMKSSFLPDLIKGEAVIGYYRDRIPVLAAIGDNQAGVYALLKKDEDILVNVGTSSQISVISQKAEHIHGLECRPYVEGKYITLYAGLCGGVSFALLNQFFSQVCTEFAVDVSEEQVYSQMMLSAQREYERYKEQNTSLLQVNTRFRGTRSNPSGRGSISNIGIHNLTPGTMVLGFYRGVCEELYEAYQNMGLSSPEGKLILAGNAFRKNTLLQTIIADLFGRQAICTEQKEEAATGAARLAANKVLNKNVIERRR